MMFIDTGFFEALLNNLKKKKKKTIPIFRLSVSALRINDNI